LIIPTAAKFALLSAFFTQWIDTVSPNKPKIFKQTLCACQKADGNCFLGQEKSSDGEVYATMDHSNIRSVLRNTKTEYDYSEQMCGMLTHGVVFLHDNARLHTDSRTPALLDLLTGDRLL
jgi:hypothetical protein